MKRSHSKAARAPLGERQLCAQKEDEIAEMLLSEDPSLDRYPLLLALGRSMAKRHESVVESFLDATSDPMLARLAIQVLCHYWSETHKYLPWIESAIDGFEWDEEDDVRLMAISIAGEYLRLARRPELLRRLLKLLDDPMQDGLIRQASYESIVRAMSSDRSDLPRRSTTPPLERIPGTRVIVSIAVIDAARERLANEIEK